MKTKYIIPAFIAALFLVSCTSVPKEEPAEPEPPVQQEPAEPATEVQPAPTEPEPVAEKPVEPKKDYTEQNSVLFKKLEAARKAAVDARAPELLPDAFSATDDLYNRKKEENKDTFSSEDLSSSISDMTARYKALENAANAYTAKQKIDEQDLSQYDKADYEKGEAAVAAIVELYNGDADGKALLEKASEGNAAYSKVLITGLKKVAAIARSAALAAKRQADSVYAGVSQKKAYKAAADMIVKADSNLVTGDPEAARTRYQKSAEAFTSLYKLVSEKRAAAQDAMDAAQKEVEDAAAYATEADGKAPLGEDAVEGIEPEDSVLLQSDTYEDPAASVIDVNDTADGKAASAIEQIAAREAASDSSAETTSTDTVTGGAGQ